MEGLIEHKMDCPPVPYDVRRLQSLQLETLQQYARNLAGWDVEEVVPRSIQREYHDFLRHLPHVSRPVSTHGWIRRRAICSTGIFGCALRSPAPTTVTQAQMRVSLGTPRVLRRPRTRPRPMRASTGRVARVTPLIVTQLCWDRPTPREGPRLRCGRGTHRLEDRERHHQPPLSKDADGPRIGPSALTGIASG